MIVLLFFLYYCVGLLGTLILVPGIPACLFMGALDFRRTGQLPRKLLVALAMLCGFIGGAALVWSLIPSQWTLPFWTTIQAAGDAEKYGHPVEHYAENVVMLMMTGAVVAAAGAGAATAAGWGLRKRRTVSA